MKIKKFRRSLNFVRDNIIIVLFVGTIMAVGLFVLWKNSANDVDELYIKVKVSQGLWWASAAKPTTWYTGAITKGLIETEGGEQIAEVISVRQYPSFGVDQFDVYMTLKLYGKFNKKDGKFFFKRNPVVIASPIDFEFPSVYISGTVMRMSDTPFEDVYVEKTLHMTKNYANIWEYDLIQVGDTYFDGEDTVLEIVDKKATDSVLLLRDLTNNYSGRVDPKKDITLTVRIKVLEDDGKYIYGEEQLLRTAKLFYGITDNFSFLDYVVADIE